MPRNFDCMSTPFTLLISLLVCKVALTQTLNVSAIDRGWYSEAGFHDPNSLNYNAGDTSGITPTYSSGDLRNFFVFDLTIISEQIESAKLALFVPGYPFPGFESSDPSEDYELHDVSTPIATLLDGTGGVAAHTDLGNGVDYGSRTMTDTDNGTVVEITFNSSAIDDMNLSHGLFAIGGSIITLDDLPDLECTFGFTNAGTEITQLRLTLVPEPSTLFLLAIGAISLLGYGKAKTLG
jgi:hypothetical protein